MLNLLNFQYLFGSVESILIFSNRSILLRNIRLLLYTFVPLTYRTTSASRRLVDSQLDNRDDDRDNSRSNDNDENRDNNRDDDSTNNNDNTSTQSGFNDNDYNDVITSNDNGNKVIYVIYMLIMLLLIFI